jgi:FkbM family methyltransferase
MTIRFGNWSFSKFWPESQQHGLPTLFFHETNLLRKLKVLGYDPAVIYDIGASNGEWSDTMALVLPDSEYHLFEPLADTVDFYRKDLAERCQRRPRFHLHPVALGDSAGTAEFFVTHDGFGSSMLDRGGIPEVKQRIDIRRARLDDYIAEHCLPLPNVIKIDCQGAERMILDGASAALEQADMVLLETWLERGYGPDTPLLGEMIEYLAQKAFFPVETGEKFYGDRGRLYSIDVFFFSAKFSQRFVLPQDS